MLLAATVSSAGVLVPPARGRAHLQLFHYPSPLGGVAVHCRSCTAHCPLAVRQYCSSCCTHCPQAVRKCI